MADPEFDPPPLCTCGVPTCRCYRCHGSRWVAVQDDYAVHMLPDPDPATLALLGTEQQALVLEQLRLRRAALANTVYPCKACNTALFFRWAAKHFDPDHDVGACDECMEARGGRRVRRMSHAGTTSAPPDRKDLA